MEKKRVVLVVDDDHINRSILKIYFEKDGYFVYEAKNGQEAIDIILANKEIINIVLDLNMPVMDGYTFIEQSNMKISDMFLRIFITSAHSKEHYAKTVLDRKINTKNIVRYFEKPFLVNKLIDAIKNIE
ncbi:MAG: response regulator [Bacteroidota bacterium]